MAISAIDDRHCQDCRRPISDPTSRAIRLGPCCRKGMTPDQLRAAILRAQQAADPFNIPAERRPSPVARRNRAVLAATIAQSQTPETAACHHGGTPGRCPMCRQEADPHRAAERILRKVKQERQAHGYDRMAGLRIAAFLRDCQRPVGRTPRPARPRPQQPAAAPTPEPTTEQLALVAL